MPTAWERLRALSPLGEGVTAWAHLQAIRLGGGSGGGRPDVVVPVQDGPTAIAIDDAPIVTPVQSAPEAIAIGEDAAMSIVVEPHGAAQ